MLAPYEIIPFDIYLAGLVSMQFHPGAGTKEHVKLSVEECKEVALEMIRVRRTVIANTGD